MNRAKPRYIKTSLPVIHRYIKSKMLFSWFVKHLKWFRQTREGEKKPSDLAYLCHWSGMYLFSFWGRNDRGNAPLTMMKMHMLFFFFFLVGFYTQVQAICLCLCIMPGTELAFTLPWMMTLGYKLKTTADKFMGVIWFSILFHFAFCHSILLTRRLFYVINKHGVR